MSEAEKKLNIAAVFPPVSTESWEAIIEKDLKGADYEKKLVWRTDEGFSARPYYRSENLVGLENQLQMRRENRGWEICEKFEPSECAIRGDLLHEAGATAVEELGYAIAEAVECLAEITEDKPAANVADLSREITFVFAAGPGYFIEIAKLRAARLLWAQAVAAFGAKDPVEMRIVVRTPLRNKGVYDRYTNLLRATTESLSAVVGGCDALYVEPFGFDDHIALNIQRILKEESNIDAVADPAGGSYYIETLTDSIARDAWKLFQEVETSGGYSKAEESGSIEEALGASRESRAKAISSRRKTLVGVNNYPNLMEIESDMPTPADSLRLAEPFEKIRQRTIDNAKKARRYPRVLLLTRGDVKMRGARSNFALNFFGCAAFAIDTSDQYVNADADMIVLCSSDPEYLEFAREVCPKVNVPVLVAGNPKDQIEALEIAGVKGFIHVLSDVAATLTEWQDKLGLE